MSVRIGGPASEDGRLPPAELARIAGGLRMTLEMYHDAPPLTGNRRHFTDFPGLSLLA
ncbi:hypothetical protein ACFYY8_28435 [Streptosporangium sp. NPDC001559]|uniref:hypothetical protein n=1 Tax=Streptosporangium sp. NPDC001559 TaxID=3366187 RepID=UPI0036E9B40C